MKKGEVGVSCGVYADEEDIDDPTAGGEHQ
jgi:hypothetical protein